MKKKGAGTKLLKSHLASRGPEKASFKAAHKEAVHLRAGGRSRINDYKESVEQSTEFSCAIIGPKKQFWELSEYTKEFGNPKDTKAKVVSRTMRKGKGGKVQTVKGVYVQVGRSGVWDVEEKEEIRVKRNRVKHDGDAVLEGGEIDEVMEDAIEDQAELAGDTSALTLEQTDRHAAQAAQQKSAAQHSRCSEVPESDSSTGSGSDNDSDDSDSGSSHASSAAETQISAKRQSIASTAKHPGNRKEPKPLARKSSASSSTAMAMSQSRSTMTVDDTEEFDRLCHILTERVGTLRSGGADALRGRASQNLLKEWGAEVAEARKFQRRVSQENVQQILGDLVPKVERTMALARVLSKPQPLFSEVDKAYSDVVGMGIPVSSNITRAYFTKKFTHKAGKQETRLKALDEVYLIPEEQEGLHDAEGAMAEALIILLKPLLHTNASTADVQTFAEDTKVFFATIAVENLPETIRQDVTAVNALLDPTSAAAEQLVGILETAMGAAKTTDGRRVMKNSVLATFVLSKLGKHALRNAGACAEANTRRQVKDSQLNKFLDDLKGGRDVRPISGNAIEVFKHNMYGVANLLRSYQAEGWKLPRTDPAAMHKCISEVMTNFAASFMQEWMAALEVTGEAGESKAEVGAAKLEKELLPNLGRMAATWDLWINTDQFALVPAPLPETDQPTPMLMEPLYDCMTLCVKTLPGQSLAEGFSGESVHRLLDFATRARNRLAQWDAQVGSVQTVWRDALEGEQGFDADAFALAFEWVKDTVVRIRTDVTKHLDITFGSEALDNVLVSYMDMKDTWTPTGDLDSSADFVKKILQCDKTTEITRMESLASVSKLLAVLSMENKGMWEARKAELGDVAASLPAYHSACLLSAAMARHEGAKASAEEGQGEYFEGLVQAYFGFAKELQAMLNSQQVPP